MEPIIHGPHVGLVMREACERAMRHMLRLRFKVELEEKGIKADGSTDWVTRADTECQEIIVKLLREHFIDQLGWGLICEEEGLRLPCQVPDANIYFTVDPIDGTSAYGRRVSHGFGPMLSLVQNGEVVAVCIGDATTGELYYYRPNSDKTHRLIRVGDEVEVVPLAIDPDRKLARQYLLLRNVPAKHGDIVKEMCLDLNRGVSVAEGSIGLSMARLWKGEVGSCVLNAQKITPWDDTPIIGMSLRLGFHFYYIRAQKIDRFVPKPSQDITFAPCHVLVIHSSRHDELQEWCKNCGLPLSTQVEAASDDPTRGL